MQTSRHQHLQAPSYQNYLFSETTSAHYRTPVNMQGSQPYSVRNTASGGGNQVYTPSGQVSPQLQQQIQMQRKYPQVRPAQGNLFNSKLGGSGAVPADRKIQGPQTQHANPMQIIAQLHTSKGKQRSYSRAYESPRNGQFTQYSSRKNGPGKAVSSTGNGAQNQRRINQTIDVGAAMEHLDLDVGIPANKGNDLTTLQPVDLSSPIGVSKIPHQPVTPSLNVNSASGNGQKGGNNNFLLVN